MQHLKELDDSRKLVGTLQAIHTKVKEHIESSHPGCTPQPGNKLDTPVNNYMLYIIVTTCEGLVSVNAMLLLEDIHWLLSLTQEANK